ncbi:MAG: hypothetical protein OEV94_03530 [Deltaproteobacteria bacterium]|nr:hypothetical protein [Deltaproteobacteria bacterium]
MKVCVRIWNTETPAPFSPAVVFRRVSGFLFQWNAPQWGLVALAAGLLAGCSLDPVYQTHDAHELAGREVLFLNAPRDNSGLPAGLKERLVDQVEANLSQSPLVKRLVTRSQFLESAKGTPLANDYLVYSETLAQIGVSEIETANRLGKSQQVSLLFQVEFSLYPCDGCLEGSQAGVVGTLIDTATGEVVWRIHLSQRLDENKSMTLDERGEELTAKLLARMEATLTPRWHKLRFMGLKRLAQN